MKYRLGNKDYRTKADVIKRCQGLLHCRLKFSDEDNEFLLDVLRLHRKAPQKIGPGVKNFYVERTQYNNRGFWLERIDGSRTDWSYLQCLSPSTHASDVRAALRNHIRPQIVAFRDTQPTRCAVSGEILDVHTMHVDHVHPKTFLALVEAFLLAVAMTYDDIDTAESVDGNMEMELVSPEVVEAWQWYHQEHAVLRVISKRLNLQKGPRA